MQETFRNIGSKGPGSW